jgi:hypothetical protein
MKTVWSKKVKWFKSIILPELECQYTYNNSLGEPVECVIIKEHKDGYVDILNINKVTLFHVHMSRLTKIES